MHPSINQGGPILGLVRNMHSSSLASSAIPGIKGGDESQRIDQARRIREDFVAKKSKKGISRAPRKSWIETPSSILEPAANNLTALLDIVPSPFVRIRKALTRGNTGLQHLLIEISSFWFSNGKTVKL